VVFFQRELGSLTFREDADSRVEALKARMEALRKRREGRPVKAKPGKEKAMNETS
jgi:hypothetical protein